MMVMLLALIVLVMVMVAAAVVVVVVIIIIIILIVMVMAAVVVMVVIIVIVMVMVAAMMLVVVIILVIMVMVMMVMLLFLHVFLFFLQLQPLLLQSRQLRSQRSLTFHGLQNLLAGQLVPRGGDNGCNSVMLPDQSHSSVQFILSNRVGPGQEDGGGGLDLVVVELTEVLHIDLHLGSVGHGYGVAQGHIVAGDFVQGTDHIGQLAHTGGLDEDTVRMVLGNDLLQGLAEVAHQGAADAAGVHFGNGDSGLLQKAAVNADLTELVLDEDQLFALVALGDHFLDQGRLTGSQKSGVNVDFGHKNTF